MQKGNQRRSPALDFKSEWYPERYNGKVPRRVRMEKTVRSDLPAWLAPEFQVAKINHEYDCYVNSHGAVSAVDCGKMLGLKPDEFTVIKFHQAFV